MIFSKSTVFSLLASTAFAADQQLRAARELEEVPCGVFQGCYLYDRTTETEVKLTGSDTYCPSASPDGWSVRCDTDYPVSQDALGNDVKAGVDEIKFFYGGLTIDEYGEPRWMNGDSGGDDGGKRWINDVDFLAANGDKEFSIEGRQWSMSCFTKTYTLTSQCGAPAGYLGCFQDGPVRDLKLHHSRGGLTTEQCKSECAGLGYGFAAMQYASHCFCGNSFGSMGKATNCNMACKDGPGICGGGYANSVYELTPKPAIGYLGCFQDGPVRDLILHHSRGGLTTEQCKSECAGLGYGFAAMQYASHCFCGNSYGSMGKATNCNMACKNGPGICGGGYANSVYAL